MSRGKNKKQQPPGPNGIPLLENDISFSTSEESDIRRIFRGMALHQRLKQLEKASGISAREIAKRAKVPYSTYIEYRRSEKRQVDTAHLINLAKVFGVTVDDLLGIEGASKVNLKSLPTKKIFSRWVKLTIEDIAGEEDEK